MGNVGGVVQWMSSSSFTTADGLKRWEEHALTSLNPKFIDAARLVAAWPHLRSSFLTYVQSGRWLQAYYVSNRNNTVSFPVCSQTSAEIEELMKAFIVGTSDNGESATVVTKVTDKSIGQQTLLSGQSTLDMLMTKTIPETIRYPVSSSVAAVDSCLRTGPKSYALLFAAVFPLFLEHLQEEQISNLSMSSSNPTSPDQNKVSVVTKQISQHQILEYVGGDNQQENAMRQFLVNRFFPPEIFGTTEPRPSLYSCPPQSPGVVSDNGSQDGQFEAEVKNLEHLEETLVSAMAQLDFMQLNQQLSEHDRSDWSKDMLAQLESLPLGVAVLASSSSHNQCLNQISDVFLDDLRVTYCNQMFATIADATTQKGPAAPIVGTNDLSSNLNNHANNSSKGSDKMLEQSSSRSSGRLSGRWSDRFSGRLSGLLSNSNASDKYQQDGPSSSDRVRRSLQDAFSQVSAVSSTTSSFASNNNNSTTNTINASSSSSRRFSARLSGRISAHFSGRLSLSGRQSQIPSDSQRELVVCQALGKLMHRLPNTFATATANNYSVGSERQQSAGIAFGTAVNSAAVSRASSSHSLVTCKTEAATVTAELFVSNKENQTLVDESCKSIAKEDNKQASFPICMYNQGFQKLHHAIRTRTQAIIFVPHQNSSLSTEVVSSTITKTGGVLWLVHPVTSQSADNKRRTSVISQLLLLQIDVPIGCDLLLLPITQNALAKSMVSDPTEENSVGGQSKRSIKTIKPTNPKTIKPTKSAVLCAEQEYDDLQEPDCDKENSHENTPILRPSQMLQQHVLMSEEDDKEETTALDDEKTQTTVNANVEKSVAGDANPSSNLPSSVKTSPERKKFSLLKPNEASTSLISVLNKKITLDKVMCCCNDAQILQHVKLAEDVCNLLPPLLLL